MAIVYQEQVLIVPTVSIKNVKVRKMAFFSCISALVDFIAI